MNNIVKYLRLAVGIMGNCTSLLLYSAPVYDCSRNVIKEKSVGSYKFEPYVMALFNCFVYTWYGMPVVSKGWDNYLVSTVNGAGIIPECFVICTFLVYAKKSYKVKVVRMVLLAVVLFSVIALVSTFALHGHKARKCLVGSVGIGSSIIMFGSPLIIMKEVMRTRSVQYMPFYVSFFSFLTSSLWMAYGLLSKDMLLAAPNIIGCPVGLFQLMLYCKYRNTTKESNGNDYQDQEMGLESRAINGNGRGGRNGTKV